MPVSKFWLHKISASTIKR